MTTNDLRQHTDKTTARKIMAILRENNVTVTEKSENKKIVNDYDLIESRNVLRELLLKANESDRDDLFAIYEPHYDLLSLMIERGEA